MFKLVTFYYFVCFLLNANLRIHHLHLPYWNTFSKSKDGKSVICSMMFDYLSFVRGEFISHDNMLLCTRRKCLKKENVTSSKMTRPLSIKKDGINIQNYAWLDSRVSFTPNSNPHYWFMVHFKIYSPLPDLQTTR